MEDNKIIMTLEEENENSKRISEELNFPKLSGTKKQVAWANTIRLEFYQIGQKFKYYDRVIDEMIKAETESSFWISARRWRDKKEFLSEYCEKRRTEERSERIISENSVAPENWKREGIAEIVKHLDKICLFYQKDENFRQVVKSLRYEWNNEDKCWERTLAEDTGTFEDRAAEVGHELLLNGFAISIPNKIILEKAVKGDYERESTRLIGWKYKEKKLTIYWKEKDNESYYAAKKVINSEYNYKESCFEVPICHYRAVGNFAKKYNFCYTKRALAAVEQYKKEVRELRRIKIDK